MDHAGLVRRFESVGDLLRHRQRLVKRNRPARDPLLQREAIDQFEHQRPRATVFLDAVNLSDVGVVERREQLGFSLEPGQAVRIASKNVGEDLQSDVAVQARVVRAIDLAHTARAEDAGDVEVPSVPIASLQWHAA